MPEILKTMTDPLITKWNGLSKTQKIRLVSVIGVVLLAIIITLILAFRTRYVVLVQGRDMDFNNSILAQLESEGIRHRIIQNGAGIEVDQRQLHRALFLSATASSARGQVFTWDDALDAEGLATTDTTRRANQLRAHETSVAQMLENHEGISHATVIIAMPPSDRTFRAIQQVPTASVQLHTTRDITLAEGRVLASLVAGTVNDLTTDNVTITDQHRRFIFSGELDTQGDPVADREAAELATTNRIRMELINAMAPIFDGGVHVSPSLMFDSTLSSEEVSLIFSAPGDGESTLSLHEISEAARVEGSGGVVLPPGIEGNFPGTPGTLMGGGDEFTATHTMSEATHAVNQVHTRTSTGPGGYLPESSSLSFIGYRNIFYDRAQLMRLDPEFDEQAWETLKAENSNPPTRAAQVAEEEIEIIRDMLAFATRIPRENVSVSIFDLVHFIELPDRGLEWPLIIMIAVLVALLLMLLYGLLKAKKKPEEDDSMEPELSVEDLLVSTQLDDAKEEAEARLDEIEFFKDNEVKRHIDKFVNERPEAVASLLRNWLNAEEW